MDHLSFAAAVGLTADIVISCGTFKIQYDTRVFSRVWHTILFVRLFSEFAVNFDKFRRRDQPLVDDLDQKKTWDNHENITVLVNFLCSEWLAFENIKLSISSFD